MTCAVSPPLHALGQEEWPQGAEYRRLEPSLVSMLTNGDSEGSILRQNFDQLPTCLNQAENELSYE